MKGLSCESIRILHSVLKRTLVRSLAVSLIANLSNLREFQEQFEARESLDRTSIFTESINPLAIDLQLIDQSIDCTILSREA